MPEEMTLMEAVVERENMRAAYQRVVSNRGAAGVDEMSVEDLKAYLQAALRKGRGRNLAKVIKELTPLLRGWLNYFKLAEVKGIFEELDCLHELAGCGANCAVCSGASGNASIHGLET